MFRIAEVEERWGKEKTQRRKKKTGCLNTKMYMPLFPK
jgi:hypothetical protein